MKHIYLFCLLFILSQFVSAQIYTQKVDEKLQLLDKTEITTNILYDRVFPMAKLLMFNESAARDYTFVSKDCSVGDPDPCDLSYLVSPNLASTNIVITQNIPAPCDPPPSGMVAQSSTATLYDFSGNPVLTKSPAEGKMNVEKLKPGHYILVISNNGKKKSHRIIIN